jgi:hypothetical protein
LNTLKKKNISIKQAWGEAIASQRGADPMDAKGMFLVEFTALLQRHIQSTPRAANIDAAFSELNIFGFDDLNYYEFLFLFEEKTRIES